MDATTNTDAQAPVITLSDAALKEVKRLILRGKDKGYVTFDAAGAADADARLGAHPTPALSWKSLTRDPGKEGKK